MSNLPRQLKLVAGSGLLVINALGESREFILYQGDALQHGNAEQLWLRDEQGHYLRQLPMGGEVPGQALFYNTEELLHCLQQNHFYFD